ncbi:hypothetical protein [Nocardia sp. NPDC050175]|uniref:hypothetical protein n=1 Tax=Nocardia sp. NPDC050175 TaxID=3364317 RepID=UPI00379F434C
MNDNGLLSRLVGRAVDAMLGLPYAATTVKVRRDIEVPMPDGVSLLGDLYRPVDASDPMPVVLIRLPYGRDRLNGLLFGEATSAPSPPNNTTV